MAAISDPSHVWTLAIHEGKVVGYTELNTSSTEPCITSQSAIEVQKLYIARELQGKGVAQSLMTRAEEYARDQGYQEMWLGVWEGSFLLSFSACLSLLV